MNIDGFSTTMTIRIANLREYPNSTNLDKLMSEEEFSSFTEQILKASNTMSQMTISYIKEVKNLVPLISSVQESTIVRHPQVERVMLPDAFVFGHLNYGQYLTNQHVMLGNLHLENPGALEELVKEGFGGSLSG